MKLGSLFDGIGGFPLAASRHGITPAWASEIDKDCLKVTERHFSGMRKYYDINYLDGHDLEPVNVISFGSPCQNLSVAGNLEGLNGEESKLFYEGVRVIEEMLESAAEFRYAIWENVPGAFTSRDGQDFKEVLEALIKARVPMPRSKTWSNAGMVRGHGRSLAWRVLNAEHFGVPQHRDRIFIVADLRGQSAPEILFESAGLRRDIAPCREAEKDVAARLTTGTGTRYDAETETLIPVCFAGQNSSSCGLSISNSVAPTLQTNKVHSIAFTERTRNNGRNIEFQDELAYCLTNPGNGGRTQDRQIMTPEMCVRRLTPLECERLQGFPDGWTEGLSDSARYRVLGNSVAVPVIELLMERIKTCI